MAQTQVMPVHFEDFGWQQFERLVFAYHARSFRFRDLDWYGQVGGDMGRDIWGVLKDGSSSVCVACANFRRLPFEKAKGDIAKIATGVYGKPDLLRIVAGGSVSAKMRDRIKSCAKKAGISETQVWSGIEFEEFLHRDAEALLKRFCEGEPFPDSAPDLRLMASIGDPQSDAERFDLLGQVLDRPAFRTPIWQESCLPYFKKAITDTIQALNTGQWQTRDGLLLGRIPMKDEFDDVKAKEHLAQCVDHLIKLRAAFDELYKRGELGAWDTCSLDECTAFQMTQRAATTLTRHRNAAIASALAACKTLPIKELPLRWADLLNEE